MLITETRWEDYADVVIVGYGGAGAVAAIAAHDLGARVLLLEKQPRESHHTNTELSGGVFISPSDEERAAGYALAISQVEPGLYWTGPEVTRAWAHYACDNKRWIEGLGGKVRPFASGGEHRQVPGWESIEAYQFAGSGLGLMRFLTEQVTRRGIGVSFNASARRLLTNPQGEVVGVRVEMAAGEGHRYWDIQARQAVLLTCGGFEFNEELKLQYLRVYPSHFYGTPANTGDGLPMVMELGADLWHMNCCSARLVAKFPDFPIAFTMDFGGKNWLLHQIRETGRSGEVEPAGFIVVDRDGRRFTSENFKPHTLYYELTVYDSQRLLYPRVPCCWVFDRRRIEAGPLPIQVAGPSGPVGLYRWSKDNQAEIERGWIVRAESIEELARKIELPPGNLAETVNAFNGYCRQGHDPQFGRRPQDLVPISEPPYFAVRMWPGGPNTQGGPRRNARSQVLHVNGQPIPRLYAAGEFGSVYGMLYPAGGGNLAECIAFGRIAAENAVREQRLP